MRQSKPTCFQCSNVNSTAASIPVLSIQKMIMDPETVGTYIKVALPISALLGVSFQTIVLLHFLGHKSPLLDFQIMIEKDNYPVLF